MNLHFFTQFWPFPQFFPTFSHKNSIISKNALVTLALKDPEPSNRVSWDLSLFGGLSSFEEKKQDVERPLVTASSTYLIFNEDP